MVKGWENGERLRRGKRGKGGKRGRVKEEERRVNGWEKGKA